MKNLIVLMLFCILAVGCVSSNTRGVIDNQIFYSSNQPNIKITVSDDYNFQEVKNHCYVFDNYSGEAVYISFFENSTIENTVDYYYHPSKWMFDYVKLSEKIDTGTLNILGKQWYYCNSIIKQSNGKCCFARNLGHFTSDHNVLTVRYFKRLSKHDCFKWENHDILTKEQIEIMTDVIKTFEEDVAFSNYTPLKTKKAKL